MAYIFFIGRVNEGQKNDYPNIDKYDRDVIYIYYSSVLGLYISSSLMCWWSNSVEAGNVLESITWFAYGFKSHTDLNIDINWNSYLKF